MLVSISATGGRAGDDIPSEIQDGLRILDPLGIKRRRGIWAIRCPPSSNLIMHVLELQLYRNAFTHFVFDISTSDFE